MKVWVVSSNLLAMVVGWRRRRGGGIWSTGGRPYLAEGYGRARKGCRANLRVVSSSSYEAVKPSAHGGNLIAVERRVQ